MKLSTLSAMTQDIYMLKHTYSVNSKLHLSFKKYFWQDLVATVMQMAWEGSSSGKTSPGVYQ